MTNYLLIKTKSHVIGLTCLGVFMFLGMLTDARGQDPVIPKAKTKAEKKAERKNMSLNEKIESMTPSGVNVSGLSETISSVEDAKKFVSETLPDIGVSVKREAKKAKDAAKKAAEIFNGKQYKGIDVEKHILKRGSGNSLRYTEFYTSKKNDEETNPYIQDDIYWFEEKTQKVKTARTPDRSKYLLMHGPYREYKGEELVEEGFYYLGTKDGRWVNYGKEGELLNKDTYNEGFLVNSTITYYDADSTKIKEVIPNWYGKETGDYYAFNEDGTLSIKGTLDNGIKVGQWIEYYPSGNRRKRVSKYPDSCFDTSEPYILFEYDESGKMTYKKQ